MNVITQWDLSVLDALAAHRTPFFDGFFSIFTHLGDGGIVWIALALGLLCFKKTRKAGLCVAFALILDLLLCNLTLKPLVNRIRPYALREVTLLIRAPKDASFPSGHTAAGFSAAFALCLKKCRLGIPAIVLSALVAFSRLYLYVHFPTDVFGGMVLGLLCALLGCQIADRLCRRLKLI